MLQLLRPLFAAGLGLPLLALAGSLLACRRGERPGPGGDDGPGPGPGLEDSGEPADLLQLSAPPRNLLVISIDTLRRDAVGGYAGGDDTPFLDSLMAEGVVLGAHRACSSWTYPGAICAMTGTSGEELGFAPVVPEFTEDVIAIPEGTPTLASALQEAGFATRLVTANGYLGAATGLTSGFDGFQVSSGLVAEAVTATALGVAEAELTADQPWMLHVHYVDPHSAYGPPEAYLGDLAALPAIEWDLATDAGVTAATNAWDELSEEEQANLLAHFQVRYAGEVRYADDQIAALFAGLDALGMLDDTLVVVWSDHGEQLFDHGSRGHAGSLYGEENDGVAFLWSRDLAPAAWDKLSSNKDLPPTILAAFGLDVPASMTGEVLGAQKASRPIFGALVPRTRAPVQSVTVGEKKLIYNWTGSRQLFRRGSDPTESDNVYNAASPDVISLWEHLAPEVEKLEALVDDFEPVEPGP